MSEVGWDRPSQGGSNRCSGLKEGGSFCGCCIHYRNADQEKSNIEKGITSLYLFSKGHILDRFFFYPFLEVLSNYFKVVGKYVPPESSHLPKNPIKILNSSRLYRKRKFDSHSRYANTLHIWIIHIPARIFLKFKFPSNLLRLYLFMWCISGDGALISKPNFLRLHIISMHYANLNLPKPPPKKHIYNF